MMFGKFLNQFDILMLKKAIECFLTMLDIQNSGIPINVKTVDNIGKGDTGGTCVAKLNDNHELETIDIEIKQTATYIGMIEALAHEMVHAKQWIKKEITVKTKTRYVLGFIPISKLHQFWKGKDVTDLSYYNQPSEREAHLQQKFLTVEFLKNVEAMIEPSVMQTILDTNKIESIIEKEV